ncbi:uncharacterized protein [Panulirus ornatus]|uniref:uncharacterized protein n=1 Tax=Panulirus ornatus TaxID=150431 RepID=UPI003A8578BB
MVQFSYTVFQCQMDNHKDKYFFRVENVTLHDLYDWSCGGFDSTDAAVSRTVGNQQKMFRSPSRKATLRTGSLVKVNEQEVALFRYGDIVYAISERCPHAGGPLHIGDIETLPDQSLCVRCPYHGWKFNLKTATTGIFQKAQEKKCSSQ